MNKPVIKVNWIDNGLKQIEIEIQDGKEPGKIVYPKSDDCDKEQYECARGKFFLRIRDIFERLYGEHDILSNYGIFKDDSAVLKELICWPRNHQTMDDGNISVDQIPAKARGMLIENVRQMAWGWKLSANIELDVEPMAVAFARFEVDDCIWLFDFNADAESLLSINKDALELEWYEFNHDDNSVQKKYAALTDGAHGIDNEQVEIWMKIIKDRTLLFEDIKKGYEMRGASNRV